MKATALNLSRIKNGVCGEKQKCVHQITNRPSLYEQNDTPHFRIAFE